MIWDPKVVESAFASLGITSDPAFRQIVVDSKLRYRGASSSPDIVDKLSAAMVCAALRSRQYTPVLLQLPDQDERRAPLLFAAALLIDAVMQIQARSVNRCVLYVSSDPLIRLQLAKTRVGTLPLGGVFAQQFGRGDATDVRTLALPGGVNIPSVLAICAPARPSTLLTQYSPAWIAVDAGRNVELAWLPDLLRSANEQRIPVVGWAAERFGSVAATWVDNGGALFRWPLIPEGRRDLRTVNDILHPPMAGEICPHVLAGEHVAEVSRLLAAATHALIEAASHRGRVAVDAVRYGWRYLRATELIPVSWDLYEREAPSHWGLRSMSEMRAVFARFVHAASLEVPAIQVSLDVAAEALDEANRLLATVESPLWRGLVNLCVDSSRPRSIVFTSRARRQMFSFELLAKFNISVDDLRDVDVELSDLSTWAGDREAARGAMPGSRRPPNVPLVVGLPSRYAERYLPTLLEFGYVDVLLWPHQLSSLERRVADVSRVMGGASVNLASLVPTLETKEPFRATDADARHCTLALRPATFVKSTSPKRQEPDATDMSLWMRPVASEAIASLFSSIAEGDEHENENSIVTSGSVPDATVTPSDESWTEEAIRVRFTDGRALLLPIDEPVNVIVQQARGSIIESRYVRALRPGDEILFIPGQRRQSVYDLLVSRVHRDPIIAQYLALVRRWQDDFVDGFAQWQRLKDVGIQEFLSELQIRGSRLRSTEAIRFWLRRMVLAPDDVEDLRRVADLLRLEFVGGYYRQIHRAGRRLKGLHISLSARLNRWLTSRHAGEAATGSGGEVIDAELGLTIADFRDSLLRLTVANVTRETGAFYRPHLGQLTEEYRAHN